LLNNEPAAIVKGMHDIRKVAVHKKKHSIVNVQSRQEMRKQSICELRCGALRLSFSLIQKFPNFSPYQTSGRLGNMQIERYHPSELPV
jgi:hypothetical protein